MITSGSTWIESKTRYNQEWKIKPVFLYLLTLNKRNINKSSFCSENKTVQKQKDTNNSFVLKISSCLTKLFIKFLFLTTQLRF